MFKKYSSIENSYQDEFIDRIKGHGFWNDEFVVQEKVHGANLSFWTTNGTDFFAAKRTGEIEKDENFYNHTLILEEIVPKLRAIWSDLKGEFEELNQLTIFGELFGGEYPHPDVPKDKTSKKVQKGVFYSPSNHFYAFDILVDPIGFLNVDEANFLFEKHHLLHAKTIFRGSIEECLAHPNDFNSTVYKEFNLPEITPNIVEGVVIKPLILSRFNNGVRVILKNKNEKWAEKKYQRNSIKVEDELSEKVIKLQEVILSYVTENRLNNVLSKIGPITPKDFGKILGMFNKDVVVDFLKDYHSITDELEKKEVKQITKSFSSVAVKMVQEKISRN